MFDHVMEGRHSDLADLPTERLEAEMMCLAGHLAAATCSFLLLVGEFDRREGWASWECLSTAHWLSWRCGVGLSAAREQVRVGLRLGELPVVLEEFGAGRLSYSKVRAITRVATPEIEAGLVRMAQSATASQMDRACRALRRTQDLARAEEELQDQERSAHQRRAVSWHRRDDGTVEFRGLLGGEDAEVLIRALTAAAAVENAASDSCTVDQRRADAVVELAAAYLADPAGAEDGRGSVEVVLHVDSTAAAQLAQRSAPGPDEQADEHEPLPWPVATSSGMPMSFASLERLACDCGRRMVIRLPDGTELNTGRHTRAVSRAQRRALLARDRHCRFPGCNGRSRLRAHHIRWWSNGGATDMENLLMLCPKHHRAVHEGGWTLTGTATDHTFTAPDGSLVPRDAPVLTGSLGDLVRVHQRHGRDIALDGAGGRWHGDRIDWDCFFAAFAN